METPPVTRSLLYIYSFVVSTLHDATSDSLTTRPTPFRLPSSYSSSTKSFLVSLLLVSVSLAVHTPELHRVSNHARPLTLVPLRLHSTLLRPTSPITSLHYGLLYLLLLSSDQYYRWSLNLSFTLFLGDQEIFVLREYQTIYDIFYVRRRKRLLHNIRVPMADNEIPHSLEPDPTMSTLVSLHLSKLYVKLHLYCHRPEKLFHRYFSFYLVLDVTQWPIY